MRWYVRLSTIGLKKEPRHTNPLSKSVHRRFVHSTAQIRRYYTLAWVTQCTNVMWLDLGHSYTHTLRHVHTRTLIRVNTHECIHSHTRTRIHAYMQTLLHVRLYTNRIFSAYMTSIQETVSDRFAPGSTGAKGEQTQQPASSYEGRFANKDALNRAT
jgi:hypothetical protein